MAETASATRHPGRRTPPDAKVADRLVKSVLEAQKKRRKIEADLQKQIDVLAQRLNKAMEAGVETNRLADELGQSRQMVYKLVRERVDGRPLGQTKAAQNGTP